MVLPFDRVSLILAGVAGLFIFLLLMVSEFPRWLYRCGRVAEARDTLHFLRGPQADVNKELEAIREVLDKMGKSSLWKQILEFREKRVFHPFLLCLLLMFFQQCSGVNSIIFYSTQIFQQAGIHDAKLLSTFLVAGIQIVATLGSVFFMILFGRKSLLVTSSLGILLSLVTLGVYFLIHDDICHGCLGKNCTDSDDHVWANSYSPCSSSGIGVLAILSTSIYMVAFSIGWGPIPWTMMSELLPLCVRTLAASVATFLNLMFAYIVVQSFPKYSEAVTLKFTWWTYATVVAASIAHVVFFLPETKRQTLEEVEGAFEKGEIIYLSCGKSGVNSNSEQRRRTTKKKVAGVEDKCKSV